MMPNRHSLFWRLALVLVAFFLLSVWLSWTWGRSAELKGYYLSAEARSALADYARRAERAWLDDGREGIDRWLAEPRQQALDWVVVLDGRLQSLGSRPLTTEEAERLTFLRGVDWPMSSRSLSRPFISLRFPEHPEQGRVVLRLPAEFVPPGLSPAKRLVTHGLVPAGLALLLGVLLYRRWVVPLGRLRAQANALRGNDLTARTQAEISRRSDELGDLGRAFDHMAERLDEHMVLQRQLLRDLSHELRTPLARLQVAAEGTLPAQLLRERLEQEVQGMQQLVDNTLELAWMDTERPVLALEDISIPALWDLLVENARFESGWAAERFRSEWQPQCTCPGPGEPAAQRHPAFPGGRRDPPAWSARRKLLVALPGRPGRGCGRAPVGDHLPPVHPTVFGTYRQGLRPGTEHCPSRRGAPGRPPMGGSRRSGAAPVPGAAFCLARRRCLYILPRCK